MKIAIKGRVSTIGCFLNIIKSDAHCRVEDIQYAESWHLARQNDYQAISVVVAGDYFDFNLIKKKRFKGLEVSGNGASFSFIKPRGTSCVTVRKVVTSVPALKVKEQCAEDVDVVLSEYDTLELYEDRLQSMTGF